jgi:DNA-directed RNA polymerase subunit RPC12/RpoP
LVSVKDQIQWSPRIKREKILELYVKTASGNRDEELIDEIAVAFYNRCSDMVRIFEKRFTCPGCGRNLPRFERKEKELHCGNCGWRISREDLYETFQGKQLGVDPNNTTIVRKYLEEFPNCKTSQEKMILIDGLIHACHAFLYKGSIHHNRPLAVNLIDANNFEVVAFLENLPEAPDNLPEMKENVLRWRQQCLSIQKKFSAERDMLAHCLQIMPKGTRDDIKELIQRKQQNLAIEKLEKNPDYAKDLTYYKGSIAKRIVRLIENELRASAKKQKKSGKPK